MSTLSRRLSVCAAITATVASFVFPARASEPADIARLAPKRSVLAVSIPDFARFHEAFDRSELGKLWAEPSVQTFVEELTKDQSTQAAEFFKEIGADRDDLKAPKGAVGMALFMPEGEPKKDADGDPIDPEADILITAEMGENAAGWRDMFRKLIERGEAEKTLTVSEETYGEHKITVLHPVYAEAKPARPDAEMNEEDEPDAPPVEKGLAALIGGTTDTPRTLYLLWRGDSFLTSTELSALEAALDSLGGKDIESFSDTEIYKDSLAQHPHGPHVFGVLVLAQLLNDYFASEMAMGDGPDPKALFESLGIAGVRSVSFGMALDTADATTTFSLGVLAPEKKGLLSLFSDSAAPFDPGAFVPPDAATVSRLSFRFDKLYDLARSVVASLPEGQREQANQALDQGMGIAKPALDAMGPIVHVVSTYKQPFAADSQGTLFAIDLKDQTAISNTIGFLSGQAQGMIEPREFEGNTIYTSEVADFALGVGFNKVFIGQAAAVENAMRLAGRTDGPKIASEPAFKEAVRLLGADSVLYSFNDTRQALRWAYWSFENTDKLVEAQLDAAQLDPEQKAEILKGMRDSMPKWMKHLPPLQTLLNHIGDSIGELRSTPDGFRGRSLILKPAAK